MKVSKILRASSVLFFCIMTISVASDQKAPGYIEPTISAEVYNESVFPFPNGVRFSIDKCRYEIPFDKEATRICDEKAEEKFSLPVQKGAQVYLGLDYLPYKNDLLLIYDTKNDRENWGAGMATLINGVILSQNGISKSLDSIHVRVFAKILFFTLLDLVSLAKLILRLGSTFGHTN